DLLAATLAHVPDAHGHVRGARDEPLAVREEGEGEDLADVSLEAGQFAPRGNTPEPDLLLAEAPRDERAIQAAGDRVEARAHHGLQHLLQAAPAAPDPDSLVPGRGGDQRRPQRGDAGDLLVVRSERGQAPPGVAVPEERAAVIAAGEERRAVEG